MSNVSETPVEVLQSGDQPTHQEEILFLDEEDEQIAKSFERMMEQFIETTQMVHQLKGDLEELKRMVAFTQTMIKSLQHPRRY